MSCHWRVGTLDCPDSSLFCILVTLHRLPEILMYFIKITVQCSKIDYLNFYLFTDIKISYCGFVSYYTVQFDNWVLLFYFQLRTAALRLVVRSGLDVPTLATKRLHACHHARAPSGGRWNCGREVSGKVCLNADLHVTFRDLLQAVKLLHGTDGFTSLPKKGVLRIFSP
jgi:hypothetical protein